MLRVFLAGRATRKQRPQHPVSVRSRESGLLPHIECAGVSASVATGVLGERLKEQGEESDGERSVGAREQEQLE